MNLAEVIILGIVQGITEWLPISSSGHLVIFEQILNLTVKIDFDIFLHMASLLVVIIFFRKEIWEVIKLTFIPKYEKENNRKQWGWYIILSTLITGVIGWWFYPLIENFRNLSSVANWLLITSLLLLAVKFAKEKRLMGWWPAIALGLIQGLAVIPGLSRSGAVIAMGLILGLSKKDSFDYAFLLAIPAIAASSVFTIGELHWDSIYLIGFVVTAIVGYFTLILLKQILRRDLFSWFFLYTLALSLTIILAS